MEDFSDIVIRRSIQSWASGKQPRLNSRVWLMAKAQAGQELLNIIQSAPVVRKEKPAYGPRLQKEYGYPPMIESYVWFMRLSMVPIMLV